MKYNVSPVLSAGHMVPMDVPDVSLDMVRLFVTRGSFETSEQNLSTAGQGDSSCPQCSTCSKQTTNPTENNINGSQIMKTTFISCVGAVAFCLLFAVVTMVFMFIWRKLPCTAEVVEPQFDLEIQE
jgi:hypothetical protein